MNNEMNLEKLYKNYGQLLMDISYRITGNMADAEEILQDTFRELWKRKPKGAIFAWLKKVVVNKSLNLVRDRKTLKVKSQPPDSPEVILENKERKEVVSEMVNKLPGIDKTVVILKKYHNISHREIADILDITEGNSRVILYRAMKKLKENLKPYIMRGETDG